MAISLESICEIYILIWAYYPGTLLNTAPGYFIRLPTVIQRITYVAISYLHLVRFWGLIFLLMNFSMLWKQNLTWPYSPPLFWPLKDNLCLEVLSSAGPPLPFTPSHSSLVLNSRMTRLFLCILPTSLLWQTYMFIMMVFFPSRAQT